MYLIVGNEQNRILDIWDIINYQSNGNLLCGTYAISKTLIKEVVQIDSIPEGVIPWYYAYTNGEYSEILPPPPTTEEQLEDVFLGHFGAIAFPAAFQNEVGDAILTRVFLITSVKKRRLISRAFFIVIEREALCSDIVKMKIWNHICSNR